jgi:hypothetical protein
VPVMSDSWRGRGNRSGSHDPTIEHDGVQGEKDETRVTEIRSNKPLDAWRGTGILVDKKKDKMRDEYVMGD